MPFTGRGGSAVEARTVVVQPPSSRREGVLVARTVFHIVFWTAFLIGLERGEDSTAGHLGATSTVIATRASVGVGEVALADLDPQDQQMFREIREAVGELERVRAGTGAWPLVAELAASGLQPFATTPGGYRWRMLREGVVTNYLGLPEGPGALPTFMIVLVEPEPGIPVDPRATLDEIHHRLADGTLLHVSIWKAPGARAIDRPLAAPAPEDGWARITSKSR